MGGGVSSKEAQGMKGAMNSQLAIQKRTGTSRRQKRNKKTTKKHREEILPHLMKSKIGQVWKTEV